jgi:hypothetical protein
MSKYFSLFIALFWALCGRAQTNIDAFNYSQSSVAGTARYISMGGAFSAVGGDLTTMAHNPAGLAIYRRMDISFSPSVYSGSTQTDYLGSMERDGRTAVNIGNVGIVVSSNPENGDKDGWVCWNFGVAYNRIMDFNNVHSFRGFNSNSSLLDHFAQQAQGKPYTDLDSYTDYLAYYTYLINPDSANSYSSVAQGGNVLQTRTARMRGSVGETDLTVSGNYANKLYVGASLGISRLNYREDAFYQETDSKNVIPQFNQYDYTTSYTTFGSGINLKLGLIFRPSDFIRVGASIQTPTWYKMSDDYTSSMYSKFDSSKTFFKESPQGAFDYTFNSPFKANGGLAFIFEDKGLLSVDYTYTDFSLAEFNAFGLTYSQVNTDIYRTYTATHDFRAGTEWRIGNISLRGGLGYTTSPLNEAYQVNGYDFSQLRYSGGIGIRDKVFYLDMGYLYSVSKQYYQPYYVENVNVDGCYEKVSGHNFTLTLGAKF